MLSKSPLLEISKNSVKSSRKRPREFIGMPFASLKTSSCNLFLSKEAISVLKIKNIKANNFAIRFSKNLKSFSVSLVESDIDRVCFSLISIRGFFTECFKKGVDVGIYTQRIELFIVGDSLFGNINNIESKSFNGLLDGEIGLFIRPSRSIMRL
jgi:hypothetical protein